MRYDHRTKLGRAGSFFALPLSLRRAQACLESKPLGLLVLSDELNLRLEKHVLQ